MKEDWTKQMKQKLDGHQMPPPAGLWDNINSKMSLEPASMSVAQHTLIRRWYWAAAAIVIAIVGFFAFYDIDHNAPKLEAKTKQHTPVTGESPATDTVNTITPIKPVLLAKATITPKATTEATETIEATTPSETEEISVQTTQETNEQVPTEASSTKQTTLPDVTAPTATGSKPENNSKWTIGLTGSNGLLLAANDGLNNTSSHLYTNYNSPADYYGTINKGYLAEAYSRADFKAKHHIPIRLGLSVQYQLNNRLALTSGISYILLKSEFTIATINKRYDQELSYVGIPLGLSWKLWSTEHLNIYLTGGTMLEKCINVDTTQDDIHQNPWQWSLNTSAGIEYNFTRQFGVYLEPSMGYYFDDRTSIQHYYKEHRLAPSVQFGLRLHLK